VAIGRMISEHDLSERRACRLVGLSRDSYRHPPEVAPMNQILGSKIVEIAHARRRFGYRRIHDLLRPEFPGVNHKRVYRLYRAADLAVRKRRKVKRPSSERVPLQLASRINAVWSLDFVSDSLVNGRRLKCLTVADDFSHECVDIAVDYGISGQYVTRLLDRAATFRGYPSAVRTDNGPEFTSRAFMGWAQGHGIRHILIQPGRPMQNGYIESFNGKFRDECLNEHWFQTLHQARTAIGTWRQDYNQVRPHSSIGRIPPARFAELHRRLAADAIHQPNNEDIN
jgi:putative transposase